MAKRNVLLDEGERTEEITDVRLTVVKLVFNRQCMWEFVYMGIKISARVDDAAFWAKVQAREARFAEGDVLVADMEIAKIYDHEAKAWLNKSYRVIAVHEHHQAPDMTARRPLT